MTDDTEFRLLDAARLESLKNVQKTKSQIQEKKRVPKQANKFERL